MTADGGAVQSPDQKLMALGPKSVSAILLFYLVLMITASLYSFNLFRSSASEQGQAALNFCISLALIGATIFYSRKLYKACISDSYNFISGTSVQVIGTFFFFILRPIFAAAFAWVTHMIWEASIISSVSNFTQFSTTHLYLSGVLGFFVGFLTGRVLTRMETVGEKHLNGVW